MAARGRGRGRGGRGGRGGPSLGPPGLRDDDGNLLQAQLNHGPPPLFPVLELPHDPPQADAHDQLLLLRRSDLLKFYRASPYHMGNQLPAGKQAAAAAAAAADGGGGDLADVERYADRFNKKAAKTRKLPLASLLTLHPYYFPDELFTDRDKRLAARAGKSGADLFKRSADGAPDAAALAQTLDKLNQKEAEEGGREGGGAGGGEGEGDDAEAVDAVVADEDDDDVMEEDDYYQGEYFDDDEGYDDLNDDGGDDGPVY